MGDCSKLLALVPSGILQLNCMVLISFDGIKRKSFYPPENTKNLFLALAFPSYLKIFIKYGGNINRAVSRAVLH